MRKLYVIPIIHTSADMGTVAGAIDKRGRTKLGEDLWQSHKRTIEGFWLSIADFLDSLPAAGFKLYQDGLIADGEIGMKIVEQGVKDGSKNYEIIAQLLGKGVELVKTEDFSLVKKEYDFIWACLIDLSPELACVPMFSLFVRTESSEGSHQASQLPSIVSSTRHCSIPMELSRSATTSAGYA